MPQRKKTVAQHRLTATYRPSRHQQREADREGVGEAPAHLSDADLKATWAELQEALPYGVGGEHDRIAFELTVRLVARLRSVTLTAAESTLLVNLLGGFGLTPAGRQKLDPEPPPPDPSASLTGLARFRKLNVLDTFR